MFDQSHQDSQDCRRLSDNSWMDSSADFHSLCFEGSYGNQMYYRDLSACHYKIDLSRGCRCFLLAGGFSSVLLFDSVICSCRCMLWLCLYLGERNHVRRHLSWSIQVDDFD